jgi:hypothetical protein
MCFLLSDVRSDVRSVVRSDVRPVVRSAYTIGYGKAMGGQILGMFSY